jgi:polysaccharide export outer membrane protein
MRQRPLKRYEWGCLWAGIAMGVLVSTAAAAGAAEPLPASRQTLELASAVSPPQAMQGGGHFNPAAPHATPAIDCVNHCPPGYEATWKGLGPVDVFEEWAQGEYVGRSRLPHVPVYRLRVDDALDFEFRVDRDRIPGAYKLTVGDELVIESVADAELRRTLIVQPDGRITLPKVGQVEAAGRTTSQLRDELEEKFKAYFDNPAISVAPLRVNSKLEELRATVAGQIGFAKQVFAGRVTPEGTVQLPAVGSVPAQGLTLDEFKLELDERYGEEIEGIEVVPALKQHGPRYVYVLGEVRAPGRYTLDAPTTVMQAIALAGYWTVGAHMTNIVIFRRGDDWRLTATVLDMRAAFAGKRPCPAGEIWVSDADMIIVPKSKIERFDNFVDLVFTRGVYGVIPMNYSVMYNPFKGVLPILPVP